MTDSKQQQASVHEAALLGEQSSQIERPPREAAEQAVVDFLDKAKPGYPEFQLVEDGDDGWAFWIRSEDTTSYVHHDLRIEWYGSGWPDSFTYDGLTGEFIPAGRDGASAAPADLWAIFDSEGFYEAREAEGEASRFCEKYNAREGDPLKPYSYRMAERRIENVPTCPACGHGLTDDEMHGHLNDLWALAPDEGRAEIACPACGVSYHCQGGYRPEYTTALDENDL